MLWHWRRHENPCHQHGPFLSLAPDPQCTSLSAVSRLGDSFEPWWSARLTIAMLFLLGFPDTCKSGFQSVLNVVTLLIYTVNKYDHNATAPGNALVACLGVYPDPGTCAGLLMFDWYSATVPGWHSKPVYQRCCSLSSAFCCYQLDIPQLATERSPLQRCAPGTVCHPRYAIRTPCWRSDEWLNSFVSPVVSLTEHYW